jgi:hypothetical protein
MQLDKICSDIVRPDKVQSDKVQSDKVQSDKIRPGNMDESCFNRAHRPWASVMKPGANPTIAI